MSRNALFQLSSFSHLHSTWREIHRNTGLKSRDGFGLDGVSINSFKKSEQENVKNISRVLRDGSYRPGLLLPYFIPKASGKDRVICVPTIVDRIVQRAMLNVLDKRGYTFKSQISYGFIKGRSVKDAARKGTSLRQKRPWVYKADISAFFDAIDRGLLIDKINKKVRLPTLQPIIKEMASNRNILPG